MASVVSSARPFAQRRSSMRYLLLASVSTAALLLANRGADARGLGTPQSSVSPVTSTMSSSVYESQAQIEAAERAQSALQRASQAIQAVQAAQAAAHSSAATGSVPNGLTAGGLVPVANPLPVSQDTTGLQTWDGASLPTQGLGVNGQVNVTITQTQQNAILTWQSFNVGSKTTLTFNQQGNTGWTALNRVLGNSTAPSQILGQIKSDGTVLVINQNGIIFGAGAQINVGSLIASSLDIGAAATNTFPTVVYSTLAQRNQTFMADGIIGLEQINEANNPGVNQQDPVGTFTAVGGVPNTGTIQVNEGASITTNGSDGLILLMAPQIVNNGYLSSPAGQVALAAGGNVGLAPATGAAGSLDPNIRGVFVNAVLDLTAPVAATPSIWNQSNGVLEADQGNVTLSTYGVTQTEVNQNGNLVFIPTPGGSVRNDGTILATTSVSRNGSILISGGNIQLSSGSLIAITPDLSDQTIPQNPTSLTDFKPSEIAIGVDAPLSTLNMQSGAFIYAPGANVTMGGGGGGSAVGGTAPANGQPPSLISSVYIDTGAEIDVAGLVGIEVPASTNEVKISPVTDADVADSPIYRDSFLVGSTVYLDPRLSGVRSDGLAWTGSPLIDATAYDQLIGVNAAELMTSGGNISIDGGGFNDAPGSNYASGATAGSVIVKSGAIIDFSGGWITYDAGTVRQTQLIAADGAVVPIGDANPDDQYIGVYNGFTVDHSRWNVVDVYVNPIHSDSTYFEPAYNEGRDAGSLTLSAGIVVADGSFYGDAFAGPVQESDAEQGTGTSSISNDARPLQASNGQLPAGGLLQIETEGNLEVTNNAPVLPASFSFNTPLNANPNGSLIAPPVGSNPVLPDSFAQLTSVSVGLIENAGLGELALNAPGTLTVDADVNLKLNPGGVFSLTAGRGITINGDLTAPGGKINLQTQESSGSIFAATPNATSIEGTLGSYDINVNGELSVAGQWVNNFNSTASDYQTAAWLNGGSITIQAASDILIATSGTLENQSSAIGFGTPLTTEDISGSIFINPGSTLNLSGGGSVSEKGALNLSAKGGNLSLESETEYFQPVAWDGTGEYVPGFRVEDLGTGFGESTIAPPPQINAKIVIDPASIEAQGFGGGGTFTLVTPEFGFGTGAPADGTGTLLPMNFFSTAGFGAYNITSYKTALLPNTFVGAQADVGGFNALLDTQTLTIAAGQTLELTQSVLPTEMTAAQGAGLLALGTGGNVLSVVAPSIPADTWDQKSVSLNLGGLIELDVDQGGSIIGTPGSSLTFAKLLNEGTIRIPGGTLTQQELIPAVDISINSTDTGSDLAIGIHSLSDVFSINPDGTISTSAKDAITSGNGAGLTNWQIAGDWFDQNSRSIYLLGNLDQDQGIVLAPGSVTDLSGTTVINPRAIGANHQAIVSGTVLPGGTIDSISSNSQTTTLLYPIAGELADPDTAAAPETIIADPSSSINISGASATFQTYSPTAGTPLKQGAYVETPEWTDAGSLIADNGATLTGAIIDAHGGAPQANGGTLEILSPLLSQADPATPTANVISADMIESAGFDTFIAVSSVGSVGDATLQLNRAFVLEGGRFDAYQSNGTVDDVTISGPATLTPTVSTGGVLEIDAPYIGFDSTIDGVGGAPFGVAAGGSVLFKANTIDITGAVDFDKSITSATFVASNDISLTGVQQYLITYDPSFVPSTFTLTGGLTIDGNLTMIAGQIYPTTGSTFTLASSAANGTIDFERYSSAIPQTPYSAGGNLSVFGANIIQDGILRVPMGSLTLGSNTPPASQIAPATQSVVLGPDSITSVSADGLNIPFGTTTDQLEWFFAPTGTAELAAPPAKVLTISGANIALNSGSTVDLTGGGDVYAYEFVPGPGGSRDVLSQTNPAQFGSNNGFQYPDGRQVYAIVPGVSNLPVAAYDPIYSAGYSNLYGPSAVGREVYLSAAPGLAAGWYTLLPAQYALLPGGMRVVQQTGTTNVVPGTSSQNIDGSLLVSGYFGNALSGTKESTPVLFNVESQSVVLKNSQIATTSGTSLTTSYDQTNNVTTPPALGADAGRLALNPLANLDLETTLSAAAAPGGLGAEVDIGGLNFDILSSLANAPQDGAIHLTAGGLTNLDAASLLIGATRTNNSDGTTTLDVTAQSIFVGNDAAHPLSAPEIVLVVDDQVNNSAASNLTLADGATIIATGTLADTRSGDYVINGAPTLGAPVNGFTPVIPAPDTAMGAFFRVADGTQRLVERETNAQTAVVPAASLNIGNATVSGTSISLDTASNATFGTNIVFDAQSIAFGANALAFSSRPQPQGTIVVTPALQALLSQADDLILHSQTSIGFDNGTYQFDVASLTAQTLVSLQDGVVNISATSLDLSGDGTTPTTVSGAGVLNISADQITFGNNGSGTIVAQGFDGGVNLAATQGIFINGPANTFNVDVANLNITTPFIGDAISTASDREGTFDDVLETETESNFGLTFATTGNVNITNAGAGAFDVASVAGVPGSSLVIQGDNIDISGTTIQATAGALSVKATGAIALSNGAVLQAPGYDRTFGDANDPVTRSSPGGSVTLAAGGTGGISLGDATLSVGNDVGNAGTLSLSAPDGVVDFGTATLKGFGGSGYTGGTFSIYEGATDIAVLNQTIELDGFTGGFDVRYASGDLIIPAGDVIKSDSVVFTADGGSVIIDGTIDTSGINGGDISLYGADGVTLESTARLLAYATGYGASDTRQATGGTVTIGTDYVPGTTSTNADGSISGVSGTINVASGAVIDVSAKNPGDRLVPMLVDGLTYYEEVQGDQDGTVMFRAPVVETASNQETVDINIANSNSVVGATGISVQGFRRWDLEAVANSGDFTGVTYNSSTNTVTLDVTAGLDTVNADGSTTAVAGVNFLGDNDPGTLVNFVQNFNIASDYGNLGGLAGQSNFTANPGLDLETSGNILLTSNWNLGAGTVNQTAALAAGYMVFNSALGKNIVVSGDESQILADDTSLTYRVGGKVTGAAGILSLRAGGNLTLGTPTSTASITDGFFTLRDQSDSTYQAEVGSTASSDSLALNGGFSTGMGTTALTQWANWSGTTTPIFLGLSFGSQAAAFLATTSLGAITTQDAPYNWQANSPAAAGNDALGSAQVFPLLPNGSAVGSWSYNLVAGAAGLTNAGTRPSSNPSLIDPTSSASLTIEGSSSYAAAAGSVAVNTAFGIDVNPTYSNTAAATGTSVDSLTNWLTYIQGANFTGENANSVAILYVGTANNNDPNRALLLGDGSESATGGLFGAFAAANQLVLNSTSPSNGFRYSSATATAATTTYIAMPVSTLVSFLKSLSPSNLATIAANLAAKAKTPTIGSAGIATKVYTQVRTGTGSISLAAAGNVDLTGGPLTYMNNTGTTVSATPTTYVVGGPAIYTVGHIVTPQAETLIDPDTGVSVLIDPENLLAPSLFSTSQAYEYGRNNEGTQGVYLTDPVYLEGGGDIDVSAGEDVLGRTDTNFAEELGTTENSQRVFFPFVGSLDAPWYIGQVGPVNTAAINPQLFKSGLGALGGGDVVVSAGEDISDVSVVAASSLDTAVATPAGSLPTSALLTMGSGNVTMTAVNNIVGGHVSVASGEAQITAGGNIETGPQYQTGTTTLFLLPPDGVGIDETEPVFASDEFNLHIADATASLEAGGSISIQGISAFAPSQPTVLNGSSGNPSEAGLTTVQNRLGFYSNVSALDLDANGNITLTDDSGNSSGPISQFVGLSTANAASEGSATILPASFISTSIAGNVDVSVNSTTAQVLMVPSPVGELAIFAGGNIPGTTIGMLDSDPAETPGIFSQLGANSSFSIDPVVGFVLPIALSSTPDIILEEEHNKIPTHAKDPEPVYIYAEGDIGSASEGLALSVSKQARVYAGQDIVNMMFFGQNINSSDITRVFAGRDIIGTSELVQPEKFFQVGATIEDEAAGTAEAAIEGNTFIIGGPGEFFLEAGRNLGPFMTSATTQDQYLGFIGGNAAEFNEQETYGGGIISVGNQWNPYLPAQGASLNVFFGVSSGEDFTALRDTYVAPGTPGNIAGGYSAELIQWMQQNDAADLLNDYGTTDVNADQAYAAFVNLPELRQEIFMLDDVYFNELSASANASAGRTATDYSRGYAAVNTLFPASLGYTANSLQGGLGARGPLQSTGSLDLRLAAIETQEGGQINILGPGGKVIAGSDVATAAQAARRTSDDARLYAGSVPQYGFPSLIQSIPAGYEGILTLRGGDINSFTDSDFQLNQSRIFTEDGGNILIWSSNGNIDAGVGAKTSANFPPIVVHLDDDASVSVDALGGVTGAGIATLQADPNAPAGNETLATPRGTVDFDDAGSRVSGNLTVAAVQVLNADNVQVQGTSVGLPQAVVPNVAAETTASDASGAAIKDIDSGNKPSAAAQPSIIIVEFLGFGGADAGDNNTSTNTNVNDNDDQEKKKKKNQNSAPAGKTNVQHS